MSETLKASQPAVGDRGTLQLLAHARTVDGRLVDLIFLGWTGTPIWAHGKFGGDVLSGDIELGDADMDPLPAMPDADGLWLLTWPWEVVRDEDVGSEDLDDRWLTAKYARTCTWSRPTLDDLRAIGALPPADVEVSRTLQEGADA